MADCKEDGAPSKDEDSDEVEGACSSKDKEEINCETLPCAQNDDNAKMGSEWRVVTERFQKSCQVLALGELVHDPYFCLGEAMAAVEFMEPRMDLNMRSVSNFPPLLTAQEALDCRVELENFSDEEILGVADELLSLVTTWLSGHTLAQTVYTCIFFHDMSRVRHPGVRCLLLVVGSVVELMRTALLHAKVYVEDDHQCLTIGAVPGEGPNRPSMEKIVAAVREQEDMLQQRLKKVLRGEEQQEADSGSAGAQRVLLSHYRFWRHLLCMLQGMEAGRRASVGREQLRTGLEQCCKALKELGETPSFRAVWHDEEERLRYGFHAALNNLVLPPSPRHVVQMSSKDSLAYLSDFLEGMQIIQQVVEFSSLREIVSTVTELCSTPAIPSVLVRSYLKLSLEVLFVSPHEGSGSLLEYLVRQDMRHFNNPSSLNPKTPMGSSDKAREIVDKIILQCLPAVKERVVLYCEHRSRHQELIAGCLDLMGELQLEIDSLDLVLDELAQKVDPQRRHTTVYGCWLLYHILALMSDYIHVGFEFELFSVQEIHRAVWYLDYLYWWQCNTLKAARQMRADLMPTAKSGKQKARRKKASQDKELDRELTVTSAKKLVCSGLMRAMEACAADKKMPTCSTQFTNEELCYKHRLAPFFAVATPQPLSHVEYQRALAMAAYHSEHINFFVQANKGFATAKTILEGISPASIEVKQLLTVLKTNIVVCNLASTGRHRLTDAPLRCDFTTHRHFPILRLL